MFNQLINSSTPELTLLLGVVFLAAIGLVWGVSSLLRGNETVEHLDNVLGIGDSSRISQPARGSGWIETAAKLARPVVRFASLTDNWEHSDLRRRFIHAGWRNPHAPEAYFGAKVLLGLGLPGLIFFLKGFLGWEISFEDTLILLGISMLGGYYLPNYLLNRAVRLRQREIMETFPDALDLLTICIEAGLGLDAALGRVASEMRLTSTVVADEIEMVTLEMRAGAGKERALRNLALRTGSEDIESTVATLIQAERFGTSIGESLRVQSDTLRSKRQMRAEEMAAKIAVKLVFPLVLCILPTIFIVAGGPAMIQIGDTFRELFGNGL